MKCKNCGANYKTRELKCPYCNTENLIGKIWQTERTQAELDYEAEKKKLGKILRSSYMEDRLLTRAILILIGLYIASFLVVALIVVLSGPIEDLIFAMNKEEIEAQMEEYFNAGEYEKLDAYMEDNYVEPQDYYAYTQATLLTSYYNSYMNHRLSFELLSKEEQLEDNYHLIYALKESVTAYHCGSGMYRDVDAKNVQLLKNMQKEIRAYWISELLLTEEEIQELITVDYSWEVDEYEFAELIKDRRCR